MSLVVGLAAVSSGCATYHAAALSEADGAVVSGQAWGLLHFEQVLIEKIDGLQSPSFWRLPAWGPALVDPGTRTLTVSGHHFRFRIIGLEDLGRVELNATFQAGHAYQVQLERKKKRMTFWVEDLDTHEAASERVSAKATTRIISGPGLGLNF